MDEQKPIIARYIRVGDEQKLITARNIRVGQAYKVLARQPALRVGMLRGTVRTQQKVGRNELCPCKSGKKYKVCCLIRDRPQPYFTPRRRERPVVEGAVVTSAAPKEPAPDLQATPGASVGHGTNSAARHLLAAAEPQTKNMEAPNE